MNARFMLMSSAYSLLAVLSMPAMAGQASQPSPSTGAGIAKPQRPFKALDADPRLKVPISIVRDSIAIEKALQRLTILTKVKLRVIGLETATSPTVFHYRNMPLRDVMDSLASANHLKWEYNSEGIWVASLAYDANRLDLHRPRTAAQADLAQLGERLVDQFSQLPDNLKEGLTNARNAKFDPSDRSTFLDMFGVSLSSLPEDMQQTLHQMVDCQAQDTGSTGGRTVPTDYGDARVTFGQPNHQEGFDAFHISVVSGYFENSIGPSRGLGFHNNQDMYFNVFQNPLDRDNRVVPLEQALAGYPSPFPKLDALSRKDAIAHDIRFERIVSVLAEPVRFRTVLLALSTDAEVSAVAADNTMPDAPKRKWALHHVPLKDALDKIAESYRYTWGVSKGGVVVFHPKKLDQTIATGLPARNSDSLSKAPRR